MSIIWYMTVNGCAWEEEIFDEQWFIEDNEKEMKQAIQNNIKLYDKKYGSKRFGIVTIPTSELVKAYEKGLQSDPEEYGGIKTIKESIKSYKDAKDLPKHKDSS